MPLVPSYIKNLASYKPGLRMDDVKRDKGLDQTIKLASNENSMGPAPLAIAAIASAMQKVNRYPDATGTALRTKLAKNFDVKIENVIIGAGSEGIMSNILRTFLLGDDEIVAAAKVADNKDYSISWNQCSIHWVPMKNHRIDLGDIAEKINDYTKIIYIANPDNPMGTYITKEELDKFYAHVPKRVLVILDEAYFEFAAHIEEYPDSMKYRYDNVITLRTFSKAYGLAGLRIGYGFSHETLINNLLKVKVPFEPSYLAQVAGRAALDDNEFMEKTIKLNINEMSKIESSIDVLGVTRIPSATNFVTTFWESEEKAESIAEKLLDKGIIVRQLNAFGWPEYIRISIGLEHENDQFIQTLASII